MRVLIFCSLFLVFSGFIKAQDTIFMKTGTLIPAVILEKGDVEIKYKKFAQPEPVGIYTVFNSDVASIHYKNGTIVDFTLSQSKQSSENNPPGLKMKFNIGVSGTYFQRNESDNLRLFWRNLNQDNNLEMSANPRCFSLNLGMGSPLDGNKRNWFGAALQLTFTPSDAISASNTSNDLNEIKLNTFNYNIIMYYGHTINHKKNLIIILEPAMDLAFMSGFIKMNGTSYKESATSGFSSQFALGLDWIVSKRILASLRIGERFMKIKEEHEDKTLSSGFGSFYVNPPTNNDLVKVDWSGSYVSFGLSYSLYSKVKSGRPD